MALNLINIRPGYNKQITDTAAEGQYVDGDFVRFRYGLPEKIGGWEKLTANTLVGVARAQHQYTDLDGRIYAAIGTHKALLIYYGSAFYDITPLETAQTGGTFTTNGTTTVTVNLSGHSLNQGDLFTFTSVTAPTGSGYSTSDFTTNTFECTNRLSATQFTITMPTASNNSNTSGSCTINRYVTTGAISQTFGYGWGTGAWSGATGVNDTLNGALLNDANGTGGSGTTININSTTGFPSAGVIKVDNELISYTGLTSTSITGITRAVNGTSTAAHNSGAFVEVFTGWGEASLSTAFALDPANWSLDNFGQVLVATVANGRTFTWQPINNNSNALDVRATLMTGAPTKSTMTIVSDQDRHLIHLGTETTIGQTTSQDKMFIRFSDQENFNVYEPTSTNTAGTFRLDDGTEIRAAVKGKDYILVTTDTAAYTIQFVGAPFTFSIRKVGSNCGCVGPHAMAFSDGIVYWMDDAGGFNIFNGTVETLPCSVEDFVFTTNNPGDLGFNFDAGKVVYAGVNALFNEVTWYYPQATADDNTRSVTWNRQENCWYTNSLSRTTAHDANLFEKPYKTEFNSTGTPTFPTIQGVSNLNGASTYYAHEVGTDQVVGTTTTAIEAFVESGDFMLHVDGDGEVFTKVRRFIPDFKRLTGNAIVTINLKDFPSDTASSSPLGPFTITSSTKKIDTRARGRAASLKISNNSTGQTWRYGTFRADVQPDGRR
jgi:hypothetical protein